MGVLINLASTDSASVPRLRRWTRSTTEIINLRCGITDTEFSARYCYIIKSGFRLRFCSLLLIKFHSSRVKTNAKTTFNNVTSALKTQYQWSPPWSHLKLMISVVLHIHVLKRGTLALSVLAKFIKTPNLNLNDYIRENVYRERSISYLSVIKSTQCIYLLLQDYYSSCV